MPSDAYICSSDFVVSSEPSIFNGKITLVNNNQPTNNITAEIGVANNIQSKKNTFTPSSSIKLFTNTLGPVPIMVAMPPMVAAYATPRSKDV